MTGIEWTPVTYGLGQILAIIILVLTFLFVQFKIENYKNKDLKEFRAKFFIGIPLCLAAMSIIVIFKILDIKFGDEQKLLVLHLSFSVAVGVIEPLIILWKHPSMYEYCTRKILKINCQEKPSINVN